MKLDINAPFNIGNVQIPGRLVLAPMAGVSDRAYRQICKRHGVDLMYTEMISAKGMHYHSKKTAALCTVDDMEKPVSLQIFGSDPDICAEAASKLEIFNYDILDINMGCPVPKVVNNGEGSALLKNPDLIYKLVKAVSEASNRPVTVKVRKGFLKGEEQGVEAALAAQEAGAKAVAVHARTRDDYYSGFADYGFIRKVKEALKVPVIGNGDIKNAGDVKRMWEETGCDAFMVGRAARGNPWIFEQIRAGLSGKEIPTKPALSQVAKMILEHSRIEIEMNGEKRAMQLMRKHIAWYTSGYPGSSAIRKESCRVETYEQLENILAGFEI